MSDHMSDRDPWALPRNDIRQHFEFLMLHPPELRKHVLKLRVLSTLGLLRLSPGCPSPNCSDLLLQCGPAVTEVSEEMLRQVLCDDVTLLKLQEGIWGGEAGSYWSQKIENELDAETRLELDPEVDARIKATVAASVREAFSEDPVVVSNEPIERTTAGASRPRPIQSLNSLARKKDRFFRPWLESLEERNGPGGFGPLGPCHPPPPPGPVVNPPGVISVAGDGNSVHVNNSFKNNTGSFNNMASVAGTGRLSPAQVGNVGVISAFRSLLGAQTGNTNVGTLMENKVALTVDNYLLLPANSGALNTSGMTGLDTDVNNLTKAIGTLEAGLPFIGPVIGDLTYDFSFTSLVAGQAHI
jgi:hypothetical protein